MKLIPILVAEDDPEDRFLIKESLARVRLAHSIHFVEDGAQIIDYLKNQGEFSDAEAFPKPGLVLLDLNMPKKSGLEVLEFIRADPELCPLPVVFLTTSREQEDLMACYRKGANSFISKPVDFEGLVAVMHAVTNYWFGIVDLPHHAMNDGSLQ